jgi:hypothetical protein
VVINGYSLEQRTWRREAPTKSQPPFKILRSIFVARRVHQRNCDLVKFFLNLTQVILPAPKAAAFVTNKTGSKLILFPLNRR